MPTSKIYLGSTVVSGAGGSGTPAVVVTRSAASVDEGSSVAFTLTTDPATAGASILWSLSGVSVADISGGVLAGMATANGSGVATVTVTTTADLTAEGEETMTLSAGVSSGNISVTVNDTSTIVAARYWRVNQISVPGSLLEISELQLFSNSTQQTGATVTAQSAPTLALSNLVDGSLSNRCYWNDTTAENASFWIQFDYGSGNDKAINGVKQGGFDTSDRYMEGFRLQHSSNGSSWTTLGTKSGLAYPGNNTLSALYSF